MLDSPWRACRRAGGRADGGQAVGRTGKRCMIVANTSGHYYSLDLAWSCLTRLAALGSLGVLKVCDRRYAIAKPSGIH